MRGAFFLVAAIFSSARWALAAFEDPGGYARAAAMGDAATAVDGDAPATQFNPALAGSIAEPQFAVGFGRLFQGPQGEANDRRASAAFGLPVPQYGAAAGRWFQSSRNEVSLDRSYAVSYGSRRWLELDYGFLDLGGAVKALSRSGAAGGKASAATVDMGALLRFTRNGTVGFSLLNVTRPSLNIGADRERAPLTWRAGYSQGYRDFVMAVDLGHAESSIVAGADNVLAAGLEYWLHTPQSGSFAARSGLQLGNRAKSWRLGAGWRILGAELDYTLAAPLDNGSRWSNLVELLFRFGQWSPEQQFEKVLGNELKYRQDLAAALDRAETRQKQLNAELGKLRGELEQTRSELQARKASEARLRELEERHRKAQASMDELERERQELAKRSKESLFREDWSAYQKLKLEGAPDAILIERLKKILREYKDTGVDVSAPNQELLRHLRTRPSP